MFLLLLFTRDIVFLLDLQGNRTTLCYRQLGSTTNCLLSRLNLNFTNLAFRI
ncbi:hypothetical protein T09_14718 [Trichinella sp. T9]|nr:hypothetical protein T09_14718 [Trichinella sp. T9]